ncbi:MAG: hypothetical protein RI973_521 [Bacteroidota bacterium]|jgi:hypothetical protein
MKIILLSLFMVQLWAAGCNRSADESPQASSYQDQAAVAEESPGPGPEEVLAKETSPSDTTTYQPPSQPGTPAPQPVERQIIKTANYRIQVDDVEISSRNAQQLAARHGGYVSTTELTNSNYEILNVLTIRVPYNRFDSLLNDLSAEAVFTQYRRISSEDVTEEYVDIQIRLRTKKEVRDRYIDILRNKAKTVEDVLKAEEQIRVIQEEIEAREGRLRYLKDQVAMSTIHLELYQVVDYHPEPAAFRESFLSRLVTSLKNGWELAQHLVLFLFNIWPLLILGGLAWWKRAWLRQFFRRKKENKGEPPASA